MRSVLLESLPAALLIGSEASIAAFTVATLVFLPIVGLAATVAPSAIVGAIAGIGSSTAFARHAVKVSRLPAED